MKLEGVTYSINWRTFKVGTSFFIPCLDPKPCRETIVALTKRLEFQIVTKVVIEEGVRGVRVWRVATPRKKKPPLFQNIT
jgi:hypothetical protein